MRWRCFRLLWRAGAGGIRAKPLFQQRTNTRARNAMAVSAVAVCTHFHGAHRSRLHEIDEHWIRSFMVEEEAAGQPIMGTL
jgi:hypothetical protein